MAEIIEVTADREELCKRLAAYIQSGSMNFLIGSGASLPAIKVAGDIEKEINDLLDASKDNEADRKSLDFIEGISTVHMGILADPVSAVIETTMAAYVEFVASLDKMLFSRKNQLLPRQANVFTTNYDLFIEHASSRVPGVVLNDGFDRSSSIGTSFPFSPERYFDRTFRSGSVYGHQIEVPTINLVKLHGSLSWRRTAEEISFDATTTPALSDPEKADPAKVRAFLEKHVLILPNFRKFQSTLVDRVYYDLLRMFSNAMDKGNAVLFSFGFSFADEHILDITRRALRNPTAQLIIVAYDKAAVAGYEAKFAKHRNVTILQPAAGTQIGFVELNELLACVLPAVSGDAA